MPKKNVLIVTASIGSGHIKAAAAIDNELRYVCPQANVSIVDFMSPETAYLNKLLKEIYLKMLDFVPALYEFLYNFTAGEWKCSSIQGLLAYFMKKNMADLIKKYQADIVICTHPFPCAAAATLKDDAHNNFKLFTVITDFSLHQIWLYKNVDMYFIPHEDMYSELVKRGISEDIITVSGIPVDYSFTKEYDKEQLRQKLSLSSNEPVVLIMGGGLGLGGVKYALEQLELLSQEMQILVVTGANVSLWSEINAYIHHSRHQIKVWGYSHNIDELMAISTLLISKPGALTISEALVSGLPMILHEPIPGPESENATYMASRGAAIEVKKEDELRDVVAALLNDPERLQFMRSQAKKLSRPDAAAKIVNVVKEYL